MTWWQLLGLGVGKGPVPVFISGDNQKASLTNFFCNQVLVSWLFFVRVSHNLASAVLQTFCNSGWGGGEPVRKFYEHLKHATKTNQLPSSLMWWCVFKEKSSHTQNLVLSCGKEWLVSMGNG